MDHSMNLHDFPPVSKAASRSPGCEPCKFLVGGCSVSNPIVEIDAAASEEGQKFLWQRVYYKFLCAHSSFQVPVCLLGKGITKVAKAP